MHKLLSSEQTFLQLVDFDLIATFIQYREFYRVWILLTSVEAFVGFVNFCPVLRFSSGA